MQTHPPSIGNNVKLNPLDMVLRSIAYQKGFINLKSAEPSLGIPTGYTTTQTNSVYYFPVFGITDSYFNSRKYTGIDNLSFVNKNLGYNTINPIYNIDIHGTFHALSAYIENLSASLIVPASGSTTLTFNPERVIFDTDVYFLKDTYVKNLTAETLFAEFLSAKKEITTTIYTVYHLTGAYVDNDVNIAGILTATNVYAASSIITNFLSAASATFFNLTANNLTVNNDFHVDTLYANRIYGKIDIDPFSQLYYNDKNQLSIGPNEDFVFAVRPSDDYSTDNINVPRTKDGYWWSDYGRIHEDPDVRKPYFKNLQPVFDYAYKNGLFGRNLKVYIDEDIIEGENKVNYWTLDNSGEYSGCTVTGNVSSAFYTTEWLGSNYPHLTAAGIYGGDFLWGYDNGADINGVFSYIDLPPVSFSNISVLGRWDIGPLTRSNNTSYYSVSGRRFIDSPRKISFRTYVCAETKLPFGTFTSEVSTWNTAKTKSPTQGRQVAFKHDTNLSLENLCFEFNTNSTDSTGLTFYNGYTELKNISVALLGNGIYSYGALYINSHDTVVQANGSFLGDPTRYTPSDWNNYSYNGYNYETPNIYPGYGLAIIGNPEITHPTILSYGVNTEYTGFINVENGGTFELNDPDNNRKIGRYTYLNSSIILDGKYNAYAYYQLKDNSRIEGCEYLFTTENLAISSRRLIANNFSTTGGTPTYKLQIIDDPLRKYNFKYVNFDGTFSTLDITYRGYWNWTFSPIEGTSPTYYNSNLSIYNGNKSDPYYEFSPSGASTIDLGQSLISVSRLNRLKSTPYGNDSNISYVGISDLVKYNEYYYITSPFDNTKTYTLNYYSSSVR